MANEILTETRGRVRLITLNRPDQMNAINADLAAGLWAAVQELDAVHLVPPSVQLDGQRLARGQAHAQAGEVDVGAISDRAQAEPVGEVRRGRERSAVLLDSREPPPGPSCRNRPSSRPSSAPLGPTSH